MRVREIREESDFRNLQPEWPGLLESSFSNTIFLTWEWVTAWLSAYGQPGDLRLLTARDEQGVLRGIAPLRLDPQRKYGQTVEAYSFIGDGSNDSEYLDCIIASGYENAVMEAFSEHLSRSLGQGTVLMLREVPSTSGNLAWFRKLADPRTVLSRESESPCGTVALPEEWESYLGQLRPRFRTKVRSVLRDLEGRSVVRFGFCTTIQDLERMLPILFDLHKRRWAQDGKPGVFGWQQKRDFYFAVSPLLLNRGWLRFSWLEWNGTIVACQYGFRYGATYLHLQEGYEPACEHRSIGIGLRSWSIRELLREGVREYDFLGGIGRHKTDWNAKAKYSTQILMAKANLKNAVFVRGPQWEESAKESLKAIVPDQMLAMRAERISRLTQIGEEAPTERGGLWRGVAACYFHLRLPALTRPLRDQFQLSISSRFPNLSWTRRREPCARILYYHRVNDQRDPFFPATSTKRFEQEMRFIARHHKVLPLRTVLEHLENGSSEPVLAVTFDDGYQDNFENALPILEGYGLPATIFLTTGSMDSREPLWFERLAYALKHTQKEYVEFEIDIPVRYWLRTEAERLKANGGIFAALRKLGNDERQHWLDCVIRQLGVADVTERKGRMLTWDQARQMSKRGIDFGGHTVTHPFVSKLTREQTCWEISECKQRIEAEVQQPADYFAYPNGREEDYGEWNKELLRKAGYKAALTTLWGLNYRSTDRMELRRGGPWEENPALFAYKLDWYQLVNG